MTLRALLLGIFVATSSAAIARSKTFCGVRDGTAGNASLVENGKETITLAVQGAEQALLEQADALVPGGTQNGTRYCVVAEVDTAGNPTKIVKAHAEKRRPGLGVR